MTWEMALGVIGSILAAFVGAAGAAFWGFRSWRKQRWIERREHVAEQTLADFYEARDVIQAARYPGGTSSEGQTRPRIEDETEHEASYRNALYAAAERLVSRNEFFARLEASRYRFMALFGEDKAGPFDAVRTIRYRIIASSARLARTYSENGEERPEQRRSREKLEQDIGWGDNDEDPLAAKLEAAVVEIEGTCRSVIMISASAR